ncbi:MAG: PQQ-binding-like beta-propeller repeat protein, partial [Eudoraea sp.]|nr:PQQ-binding-like beta-propeller repeat protein [Eudoraea sp.]
DSVQAGTLVDLHPINGYASPTVTSDGQKVFAEFSEFGMVAYELDGRKAWVFRHEPIKWFYGGSCSPVMHDSTIILIVNPDEDCRIVGLDPESGDSLWNIRATEDQSWRHFAIKSTPVFSNELMLLHFSNNLVAYDMVTREPAWWLRQRTSGPGNPVLKGDVMLVNIWTQMGEKSVNGLRYSFDELLDVYDKNRDSRLERGEIPDTIIVYQRPEAPDLPLTSRRLNEDMIVNLFDNDKDNAYSREEWDAMEEFRAPYMEPHGMLAMPVNGSGELTESALNWKVTDNTPEVPSGLVVKDNVFFIKNGGIITVIDIDSGEVVNHGRIGAAGAYLSSPMLAGNKIYTCSYNGTVSVLSAEDFSVLAHNKLRGKIGASPVAVDDVLYIRTDKHLYAFRDR